MDGNKIIGQMIGKVRSKNNETQQQLADALCIKREMVTYWENGTREIKAGQLAEIAKRYHVSADYLLGLSPYESDDKVLTSISKCTGLSETAVSVLDFLKQNGMEKEIRAVNAILESEKINEGADAYNLLDLIAAYLTSDFEENNRTMLISISGKIEDPTKITAKDWEGLWDDLITHDSFNTSAIVEQAHFSNITKALKELKHTAFKRQVE